jgi:thioredoxin reductase (NADPH)
MVACDGVFVAIGNVPNTDLIKGQVELDETGYVPADETTQTNIPGVFAVGDMRNKPLRQIVTAVADGAVASKYAEEYINSL